MTSGIEPEVKKYLWKIVYSLIYGLLWLFSNAIIGIYYGFAIIENGLRLANFIFFIWFLLSLGLLLWYYYKTWK
jgi:hypothetical protein